MSSGNPERFPWGANEPTNRQRWLVASSVALAACLILFASFLKDPLRHTDFSNVWFAASMLRQGIDPYPLLGPGRAFDMPYPLLYPASSFVAVIPFSFLSERTASIAFTGLSVWLLVYGSTADGWHRLPIIASAAFFDSVMAAQWTLIITAALFLPWLAFVTPCKPQNGIPVIASSRSGTALATAVVAAIVLVVASLLLQPGWPAEWARIVATADYVRAPIMTLVGFPVAIVLLKWRRPEAWLVLLSACLPQTLMWYSALALLTVARTYREAAMLSILSTIGFFGAAFVTTAHVPRVGLWIWAFFVGFTYWPCVVLILRRPNSGELPAWLRYIPSIPGKA